MATAKKKTTRRKKPKLLGLKRRTIKLKKQTGTSNTAADKKRRALPPGKRVSASGRVYTETRKNRSDKKRSKV